MSNETLCSSCTYSIRCDTWSEWKCKLKRRRIYSTMPFANECSDYKKRDKNFKESKCQCDDCLQNESLIDEESEKTLC